MVYLCGVSRFTIEGRIFEDNIRGKNLNFLRAVSNMVSVFAGTEHRHLAGAMWKIVTRF